MRFNNFTDNNNKILTKREKKLKPLTLHTRALATRSTPLPGTQPLLHTCLSSPWLLLAATAPAARSTPALNSAQRPRSTPLASRTRFGHPLLLARNSQFSDQAPCLLHSASPLALIAEPAHPLSCSGLRDSSCPTTARPHRESSRSARLFAPSSNRMHRLSELPVRCLHRPPRLLTFPPDHSTLTTLQSPRTLILQTIRHPALARN